MSQEPKTIAEHIACLSRLTGAPGAFVDEVRQLFVRKGISLEDDASPYLPALEEAFRREENIRSTAQRARRNIAELHENFQRIGKAYVEQLSRLRRTQSSPNEAAPAKPEEREAQRSRGTQITIKGDHRTYVTKPVREDLPMVPGPKELQ